MAYKKIDKNLPQILMQTLRRDADKDGYVIFNGSVFALEHGISASTSSRIMKNLQDQGKLEYTKNGENRYIIKPEIAYLLLKIRKNILGKI